LGRGANPPPNLSKRGRILRLDRLFRRNRNDDIKTEWEKNYGDEKDNCAQDGTHRPQDGTEGGARFPQDGT